MKAPVPVERSPTGAKLGEAPRRSDWLFKGFRKYCRRFAAGHFHAVRIAKCGPPPRSWDGPAIMVTNHPSWWDPIVMFLLSGLWPGRKDYGPIEAAALKKYQFLGRIGLFGVEAGTPRGALQFLRTSRAILADSEATLWVTAQGEFTDARQRPVRFRNGVGRLAAEMTRGVIVPIAFEYTFWNERTPEALIAFAAPIPIAAHPGLTPTQWTGMLEGAMEQTQDRLASDSSSRDPARFNDFVCGRTGVGGIYDAWRRVKALLSAKPFDPRHSAASPN